MQKIIAVSLVSMAIFATVAACDDDDGKQACESYVSKCPAGSEGAQTCSADAINNASNAGPVEDCIQGAADCPAANACLATLK